MAWNLYPERSVGKKITQNEQKLLYSMLEVADERNQYNGKHDKVRSTLTRAIQVFCMPLKAYLQNCCIALACLFVL